MTRHRQGSENGDAPSRFVPPNCHLYNPMPIKTIPICATTVNTSFNLQKAQRQELPLNTIFDFKSANIPKDQKAQLPMF